MQGRRLLTAGVALAALAGTLMAAAPAAGAPGSTRVPPAARPAPTGATTVALVTGDRVRVFTQPDGEVGVGVEPAPGRQGVGFLRQSRRGPDGTHVSVVPADAAPLLAAGRLDPRLFDVTELARQGVTAAAGTVPLIVRYAGTRGTATTAAPATAARTVRALPSVRGAALRADVRTGDAFWSWLTGPAAGGATALNGGIAEVWLDAVARPLLDASARQIGAPAAWQAGFTGAGVTVGVLDTGIKADHPDLAGKVLEARDFTGTSPEAGDDVGHGTHVAGIIAGTGAASGGRYRGVAPDATLISGKVCLSFGCPSSMVIAGMEWIAPRARVVNLSLGGTSTDGTDPMSQALNALSARHGTLFVAAAGNDDPSETIAAPAAADAALAVGAVDEQDATSPLSPRGPRLGDRAVKPDISAPGFPVVSARASGTPAGDADPVDDSYARMAGTSTAAPHVAGAAALLAQQHPDWRADRLKPTLTSTAAPTGSVYEQGAGRVDVARAVTQRVTATSGSLSFGFFGWPHAGPATRTVTYRNDGDAAVTLALAVTATGPDGRPAPAGLFTPAAREVTVPAHGTATVDVVADPAAGASGRYGGRLTATAAGIAVQTALGAEVEPESYDLTVRVLSRVGRSDAVVAQAVDTQTGVVVGIRPFAADGTAVARLPKGRYDLHVLELSGTGDPARPLAATLMSRPGTTVHADGAVTLDARAGVPVRAAVDRPDAALQFGELGVVSADAAGGAAASLSWFSRGQDQLYAVSTGAAVTDHTFAFFFRATLAAAPPYTDPDGYLYQLAFVERGRIPADTTFEAPDRSLARVDARYYGQVAPARGVRADFARLDLPYTGAGVYEVYPHTLPSRRTEYYTADPAVTWQHLFAIIAADDSDAEVSWSIRSYPAGRLQSHWNRPPLGPAFGHPSDGWGVTRAGDQLQVALTLLSGNDPAQYTQAPFGMTGTTTLSRDGVELGSSPLPGFGSFPLPDGPGRYTLRATASRHVPWSVVGTEADVTWTFQEPGAAAPAAPLPLLVVRAAGPVDLAGRAPAGVPYPLALTAQRQPGAPALRLAALSVDASFDDGRTWQRIPTVRVGNRGYALLRHPAGDGFVSLRIGARDAEGNTVRQTVLRAYQTAARR